MTVEESEIEDGLYGRDRSDEDLRAALLSGDVPVSVYGLGKLGLPLAAVMADVTGNVVGVDVDPTVVSAVERGVSHVPDEPGLPSLLSDVVERGALRATTEGEEAAAASRVHVIVVPTLVEDGVPDLSILDSACDAIAAGLSPGDLVAVECTVPPRTCRERVRPLLAELSGLDPDSFGVAACPERISSGRALRDVRRSYPKIVGGVDAESTRIASLLYDEVTENEVLPVADAETAEATKVFEGVYRDVNIALANELARYADELGVDVREAIEAANTQPYCTLHDPGAGVGGHCIPYYPRFLTGVFETDAPLLETARSVNDSMPRFAVERLVDGLYAEGTDPEDATVLVLGVAYRAGVAETRAAPALDVITDLRRRGSRVLAADPVIDDLDRFGAEPVELEELLDWEFDEFGPSPPDGVVLVTAHEEFQEIDWSVADPTVIVDGRDAIDTESACRAGHRVYTIGRGEWMTDETIRDNSGADDSGAVDGRIGGDR